jgi:hypothetical protein
MSGDVVLEGLGAAHGAWRDELHRSQLVGAEAAVWPKRFIDRIEVDLNGRIVANSAGPRGLRVNHRRPKTGNQQGARRGHLRTAFR